MPPVGAVLPRGSAVIPAVGKRTPVHNNGRASWRPIRHDQLVGEPIRLTYEDYCALPDDGRRYEILDGDLYESPSPFTLHQRIVGRLFAILDRHVRQRRLGEVFIAPFDVLLDEHNIVEPDIIFVSNERSEIVTEKHIRGTPDLLVEVLSSSTADRDTRDKRNIYARCGVPFYWIVDPDRRMLLELQRAERGYAVTTELAVPAEFRPRLFDGLVIELAELWT